MKISIYDLDGKLVKKIKGSNADGFYNVTWDGKNSSGQYVNSGIYLIRFEMGEEVFTREAIFVH